MAVELSVSVVTDPSGDTLPLVIKPSNSESSSLEFLKEWVTNNTHTISDYLTQYGKITINNSKMTSLIHSQVQYCFKVLQSKKDLTFKKLSSHMKTYQTNIVVPHQGL